MYSQSLTFGLSGAWALGRVNLQTAGYWLRFSAQILVPSFRPTSVLGLGLLLAIYMQMYSGFLLALYYLPDPSFVLTIREALMHEVW